MRIADKTEFYNKAINLIKRHGQVIIYFKCPEGYVRRRKITITRRCYVQHFGALSECWGKYVTSCFMLHWRADSIPQLIRQMNCHDIENGINPTMIEWGTGRNKKRIEYGEA